MDAPRQALLESVELSTEAAAKNTSADQPTASTPPLSEDVELINEFVTEAREYLAQIEAQLLLLEHDRSNPESIRICFRGFHTIKGVAGFLEFAELQAVCHEVEAVLDKARARTLDLKTEGINALLEATDWVIREIDRIESSTRIGVAGSAAACDQLVATLKQLLDGGSSSNPDAVSEERPDPTASSPERTKPFQERRDTQRLDERRLVKVDTGKIDHLVELVGELLITHSLVRNDSSPTASDNPRLARNLVQCSQSLKELHRSAMSMRMVPIGQLFKRMARLLRDLSQKSGKLAELEVSGEDVELDRNIVEELTDPLMHMVRNSIDHGIEPPKEREHSGKPPVGKIKLCASHRAGQILIEVSDDGRGLDATKILASARKDGLVPAGVEMPDEEIFTLIFESGLSTADQVSKISGRGVGMDVVRKQIQKLRGRVDIRSERGKGATFSLRLPLTLALVETLVTCVGEHRFLIPLAAVREVLKPSAGMLSRLQDRVEVVLVRDKVLPLVRIHRKLRLGGRHRPVEEGLIVVLEVENQRFCISVDQLLGKEEVVIKSLGHTLAQIRSYAGGAILSDGTVGLLLEPEELCVLSGSESP